MKWKKSSYSTPQGGNCLETASGSGAVHVRDTKQKDLTSRTVLQFPSSSWQTFTARLK